MVRSSHGSELRDELLGVLVLEVPAALDVLGVPGALDSFGAPAAIILLDTSSIDV
jgi:hypothetical protein